MSRLIDVDRLKQKWKMDDVCEKCPSDARKCQYDYTFTRMDVCGMLDDAPSVDAVEVVRCKDCRWSESRKSMAGHDMCVCNNSDSPVFDAKWLIPPDWYCADGERQFDQN